VGKVMHRRASDALSPIMRPLIGFSYFETGLTFALELATSKRELTKGKQFPLYIKLIIDNYMRVHDPLFGGRVIMHALSYMLMWFLSYQTDLLRRDQITYIPA